jgi:PAS domain-containing protein
MQGVMADITEQKEAEANPDAENRYRTMVERARCGVPLGFGRRAERSRASYISPQIERLLGFTDTGGARMAMWESRVHRTIGATLHARGGGTGKTFRRVPPSSGGRPVGVDLTKRSRRRAHGDTHARA